MKFSEKLDYLMSITNTSNSILARAIPLDPSFVSRLRTGRRTPAKNENYLEKFASFFTKGIVNNYQKSALCEVLEMNIKTFPESQETLKTLLLDWLLKEHTNCYQAIENILEGIPLLTFTNNDLGHFMDRDKQIDGGTINTTILYGDKGRQSIAKTMLLLLIKSKLKNTLYWVNEDSISWLTDDTIFLKEFTILLQNVINSGKKIVMIHTFNRSLTEMFSLIETWFPLYITGKCDSYYYPKLRDGLVKNTMFIIPTTASLTSVRYGIDHDVSANLMLTDHKSLKHLENEYKKYLSQCSPLLQSITQESIAKQCDLLYDFEQRKTDCLLKANVFSSITLPEAIIANIIARSNHNYKDALHEKQILRKHNFIQYIEHYSFTEMISMPTLESIQNSQVKVDLCNLFGLSDIYYTTEEYMQHIKEILDYLKNYPNYNLIILDKEFLPNCIVYTKKNVGSFLAKTDSPFTLFFINEMMMNNAIWDYLSYKSNVEDTLIKQKNDTINKLTWILESLSS